jgi:hypothetical protein
MRTGSGTRCGISIDSLESNPVALSRHITLEFESMNPSLALSHLSGEILPAKKEGAPFFTHNVPRNVM